MAENNPEICQGPAQEKTSGLISSADTLFEDARRKNYTWFGGFYQVPARNLA